MKKIAFFLASDTLVYLCKPILEKLFNKAEVFVIFPRFTEERAKETYERIFPDKLVHICTELHAFNQGIDSLVCANDWGAEIKLLIWWARKKGITTIAIQESVVDLSEHSDRYLFADVVLAQGEVSKNLLRRDNVIVTGNPRYENIGVNDPVGEHALINCNFTYGVFEDSRDQWINDVTSTLKTASVKFKISKHPRDFSNLTGLEEHVIPSGAGVVHEQVKDSAFLITRFSSLIHESILMGRPVIYYNPHGEDMGYDFTADENVLYLTTDSDSLLRAIEKIKHTKLAHFDSYIRNHLANHNSDNKPSQRIASEILKGVKFSVNIKYINIFRPLVWLLVRFFR
jgi:hypothetical protein